MDPVEIDPAGDILLVIGTNHEADATLLVSSTVLMSNSRVFATMFSEKFKEGQDLAASRSNSSPYRLKLPEDHYEGMRMLCNLLHFRDDPVTREVNDGTKRLWFHFAKACDKYDFSEALTFVVPVLMVAPDNQYYWRTLRNRLPISYMLDNPIAFAKISKDLILHDAQGFSTIDPDGVMPGKVSGLLEEMRNNLRSQILLDLGALLDRFLSLPDDMTLDRDFYERAGKNTHQLKLMLLLPFPAMESVSHILSLLDPKLLRKLNVTSFRWSTLNIIQDDYAKEKMDGALGLCIHCLREREHDASDCLEVRKGDLPIWTIAIISE